MVSRRWRRHPYSLTAVVSVVALTATSLFVAPAQAAPAVPASSATPSIPTPRVLKLPANAPKSSPFPAPTAPALPAPPHDAPIPASAIPDHAHTAVVDAIAQAQISGQRVEVVANRTDTDTTYANPDATLTTDVSAGPVRVKQYGAWVGVDPTLVAANGIVTPQATEGNVAFAGGSSAAGAELAGLTSGSDHVGFAWPAALPAPTLEGNSATYHNVIAGGDVVVTATTTGYEVSLVLRQAPTAAPVIDLPLNLGGLNVSQNTAGALSLTGTNGAAVATSAPPVMFSAARDARSNQPTQAETVASTVETGSGGAVLVLKPDYAFLTNPATVYPVTVDPSPNLTSDLSNYVSTAFPSGNYDTSTELHVGTYNGGGVVTRSFVRFGDTVIKNTQVTSATLNLYETWSFSCTAQSMNVQGASALNAGSTWNNQPSVAGAVYSASFYGGYSGCPGTAGWKTVDVTGLAQTWSSDGVPSPEALALLAPSETNSYQWKIFNSDNTTTAPYMSVTYNTPAAPSAPRNVAAAPGNGSGTVTWTAPSYLGQPQMTAYYIYNYIWNGTTWGYVSYNTCAYPCTSTVFTGLTNGATYAANVYGWSSTAGQGAPGYGPGYIPAAPPSAPTNVVAGGGNASTTARWSAPTSNGGSPVTYYLLEADDLNNTSVYFLNTACGTCTTGNVSGLTNGHTYAVYVWANNAVGTYGPYGLSNDIITGATDPMAGAGQRGDFTQQSFNLTDRLTASVNVGTGNLQLAATDVVLPAVNGSVSLGRVFNSMAAAAGSSTWFSPNFGYAWAFTQVPDVRLTVNANGSLAYDTASGNVATFAVNGTAYTTPAGLDATLVKNGDSTFTLTFHKSSEVQHFGVDGNLVSDTDRNGNTLTFTYPDGRLVTTIAGNAGATPNSAAVNYAGPGGRVSTIVQAVTGGSRTVSYDYDSQGHTLAQVTNANGGITSYGYDANDNVTMVTGPAPLSAVTKFAFDASHQVTKVDRVIPGQADQITSYDYTTAGEVKVSDGDGHPPAVYTINAVGQVTGSTDPDGNLTATTYTADAHVNTIQNAMGGTTTYTYSANNGESLTGIVDPSGATVAATYHNAANPYLPDTQTDARGNTSLLGYITPGNLNQITDGRQTATKYQYNLDGTIKTATEANNVSSANNGYGNYAAYGYNTVHQPTSITPPTGSTLGGQAFTYDGFGRLKTATSGAGMTTTYNWDNLDRLTGETFSDTTPPVSYTYDADGNPAAVTHGTGTTTTVYNAANQLTTDIPPAGPTLTYAYDAAGNLATATVSGEGGSTVYHYNNLDQLDQMTEPNGNIDIFAYNSDGQRSDTWDDTGSAVVYNGNTVVPPSAFAAHLHDSYNNAGQLTATETTRASSDATVVDNLGYTYTDPTPNACVGETAGQATGMRQTAADLVAGQTTTYCYDAAGELTSATTTGGATYTYSYDADGNRTADANGTHSYNSADQLTDAGAAYDTNGNLTASATQPSLAYNSINQTTNANGTTLAYGTATQADRTSVGPTSQTNGPLGDQVDTTAGTPTYYQYDPLGTLISEITGTAEYYYAYDGQGSVIALIDTTGTQRASYSYDPYGAHATAAAVNGTLPTNPWRYDGAYLDPTGLYHLGDRYYDPTTGRFTQVDPTAAAGAGGCYAYAGNDPINHSDPTGTDVAGTAQDPIPGQPIVNLQYTGLQVGEAPSSPAAIAAVLSPITPDPPHHHHRSFFGGLVHSVTHAVGRGLGCLGHVAEGFLPAPPAAGSILAELGTAVGGAGIGIFTSADAAGIALSAGFAATGAGAIVLGGAAVFAGLGLLVAGC